MKKTEFVKNESGLMRAVERDYTREEITESLEQFKNQTNNALEHRLNKVLQVFDIDVLQSELAKKLTAEQLELIDSFIQEKKNIKQDAIDEFVNYAINIHTSITNYHQKLIGG